MGSQKNETMGDDTKRYLASFINDLRSKSSVEQSVQNSRTPPSAQTGPQERPLLFKGSLAQDRNSSNIKPAPGQLPSAPRANVGTSTSSKIVLSDKEMELLKAFSKLK